MDEDENLSEQKISFKGGGDVRYVNGAKTFYLSSTAGAKSLSPISPCDSLIMPNMWHLSW